MPSGRDQWIAVAKAIYSRFGEVQVTDRAAAMTYYSILSLFPALLVVVSLLALLGGVPGDLPEHRRHPPRRGARVRRSTRSTAPCGTRSRDRGNAGVLLVVGLVLALYSASGAIGAAMRSLEAINRAKRGRSFLPNLGVRLGLTVLLALLVLIAFLAVVVAGPLFGSIAEAAGFSGVVAGLVGYLRWPIGAAALLARLRGRLRARPAADAAPGRPLPALGPSRSGGRHGALVRRFAVSSPPTSPTSAPMTRRTARSAP